MGESLQDRLTRCPDGGVIRLHRTEEILGPIIVDRPVTIHGEGATIYAPSGPVLIIDAPGVDLNNLRIEIPSPPLDAIAEQSCALVVRPGAEVSAHNVTVAGDVRGVPGEEGVWEYPASVNLGLISTQAQTKTFSIRVPVHCTIETRIAGLRVTPRSLYPGESEVELHLDPAGAPRFPGDLLLCTRLTRRRILVTGQIAVDEELTASPSFEEFYASIYSVGSIVAGYEVLGFLGVEGPEEHYRVRHTRTNLVEAMRVLPGNFGQAGAAERFLRARLAQAKLGHPNVARVYTAFPFESHVLTITEFIEGDTLEARLSRGRLDQSDVRSYVLQLLHALDDLHGKGIVHRGIQPSNILIDNHGLAKLTGFRKPFLELGSPNVARDLIAMHYMSPEQIRGTTVLDGRSDLYSLGVILYEMATGRRPFDAATEQNIADAHQRQHPPLANHVERAVSPELARVIHRALAKEPSQRYPSAGEFAAALEGVLPAAGLASGSPGRAGESGRSGSSPAVGATFPESGPARTKSPGHSGGRGPRGAGKWGFLALLFFVALLVAGYQWQEIQGTHQAAAKTGDIPAGGSTIEPDPRLALPSGELDNAELDRTEAREEQDAAAVNPVVVIDTTRGPISIELYPHEAPETVANFLSYVDEGFYNGTVFHRVIRNFMIQGGGLTVDLEEKPTRDPIRNESSNGLSNRRGTIAMARTVEPHSATTQFFINHVTNSFLDRGGRDEWGYCVFGEVIDGIEVVDVIAQVATHSSKGHDDVPRIPVVIESVSYGRHPLALGRTPAAVTVPFPERASPELRTSMGLSANARRFDRSAAN